MVLTCPLWVSRGSCFCWQSSPPLLLSYCMWQSHGVSSHQGVAVAEPINITGMVWFLWAVQRTHDWTWHTPMCYVNPGHSMSGQNQQIKRLFCPLVTSTKRHFQHQGQFPAASHHELSQKLPKPDICLGIHRRIIRLSDIMQLILMFCTQNVDKH